MKYLNKIIFINSADKSLRYAEVNLDGNVHFIGTQGVGKSALLRAILFFYNADKQKLGIPRDKNPNVKTFDDYYFPFQNSYIVYEVKTETGVFCVLAFKSQGRVAFRFFDSAYDKAFFLDNEGKAFESWDKIRNNFGRNIGYTKIINSYEEYRNILYGNNKGLSAEFRKYALLESRQYQNIPRTITNVFLNAKLDAEFVKETIIKSLNEEEIKIDLEIYKSHLKEFETELGDIQKWTERNRSGENVIEKQADNVSKFYSALKFLEKKKEDLAMQLGWALNNVKEQQPKIAELLTAEEFKKRKAEGKLNDSYNTFEDKKGKIQKEIGEFSSRLKEISKKRKEYELLNINEIIERVSKKNVLELENKNLSNEKAILTSAFSEIENKYKALLQDLKNQLKEFENSKQAEKITANADFVKVKDNLNTQYETIFENIRTQHKVELETAQSLAKEKESAITEQKIKRAEVRNKKFHEKEIESCKTEISNLKTAVSNAENAIRQANEVKKNLEKEWSLEEKGIKDDTARKIEKQSEKQAKLKDQIAEIENYISNSKDSLYGWLSENYRNWENSIGKVIDDKNVLFNSSLNPRLVEKTANFYGVEIDLNEIDKAVKTVFDYENEKSELQSQVIEIQKVILKFNAQMEKDLGNLEVRFRKKIKEQKEIAQTNDYTKDISASKLDEVGVKLTEWENRAKSDKQTELKNIENEENRLSEEKIKAEEQVAKIANSIDVGIHKKRKEKETKVKVEQQKLNDISSKIDAEITQKKAEISEKESEIKQQQKSELDTKGADTKRITEIELRLTEIGSELIFIDNNRDKVAEYNKDKRELFDREAELKNKKTSHERQLETERQKYEQQKSKFIQEIGIHKAEIESINQTLAAFDEDITEFESFKNSEIFPTIEYFANNYSEKNKTDFYCTAIIKEINKNHYSSKDRYTDLQETINKFAGNFQENNLFRFKTKFITRADYFEFADNLKEFIDENKISEYKKRVEERFAHIIRQIGAETNELISKEGEISQVIKDINNDFAARNFVGAIKSMELRTEKSANTIFQLLVEIKNFNDDNSFDLGEPTLFSSGNQASKNEKAILLLKQLVKEMTTNREKEILLSDSFELQFKIVENDNDTGWVEKLTNVGSEGTDTLAKAMINIMLLNVFKDRAARKNRGDFSLHCMMDEIGKLHTTNIKGILQFANDRNILLINCSPNPTNSFDYRYTYHLAKDSKNVTSVKRIVSKK
jgi:hypothetical protein